jgi:hypothetical protein
VVGYPPATERVASNPHLLRQLGCGLAVALLLHGALQVALERQQRHLDGFCLVRLAHRGARRLPLGRARQLPRHAPPNPR